MPTGRYYDYTRQRGMGQTSQPSNQGPFPGFGGPGPFWQNMMPFGGTGFFGGADLSQVLNPQFQQRQPVGQISRLGMVPTGPSMRFGQLGTITKDVLPTSLDQLIAAGFGDFQRTQDAANRQFARNQQQIGAMEGTVAAGEQRILGAGQQAAGQLTQAAEQGLGDFQGFRDEVFGEVTGRVDEAIELSKRGEETQREAIAGFEDRTAADIQNQTIAVQGQVQDRIKEIQGDPNMTAAQKRTAINKVRNEADLTLAQSANQINSQFNRDLAGLQQNLAQFEQQTGKIAATGAQAVGSTGVGLAQATNQAAGIAAGLQKAAASLTAGAAVTASQFSLAGRQAIAQLVQQNPETVVSMFSTISNLIAASKAGAGRVGGFNIPRFG